MGKLRVIQSSPLATIQDKGRFGYRRYGIPQSGAMDLDMLLFVNRSVGNKQSCPAIEFALLGMHLEAVEKTTVAFIGCTATVNNEVKKVNTVHLKAGDMLRLSAPLGVYAYFSIQGKLLADQVFDSFSTYLPGGFGGFKGRSLKEGDILETSNGKAVKSADLGPIEASNRIRFMSGPESELLKEDLHNQAFQIDPSSNRTGIRLKGPKLSCQEREIVSSAVVPGTIQLPPSGLPIVLMNDCQTTGGYPRIGKVVEEDMGKLAQVRPTKDMKFILLD